MCCFSHSSTHNVHVLTPLSWARLQDYNFFGHQLVLHQVDGYEGAASQSGVDGDPVPVPHFGLALTAGAFHALAARVAAAGIAFEVEPHGTRPRVPCAPRCEYARRPVLTPPPPSLPNPVRFAGQPGEQWTMFFRDGAGPQASHVHARSCSRYVRVVHAAGADAVRALIVSGNALEFKAMARPENLFARYDVDEAAAAHKDGRVDD